MLIELYRFGAKQTTDGSSPEGSSFSHLHAGCFFLSGIFFFPLLSFLIYESSQNSSADMISLMLSTRNSFEKDPYLFVFFPPDAQMLNGDTTEQVAHSCNRLSPAQ